MPEATYKVVELVGVSEKGYAEAIQKALADASKTLRSLAWFEGAPASRRERAANSALRSSLSELCGS